jgi:hypothetical protein
MFYDAGTSGGNETSYGAWTNAFGFPGVSDYLHYLVYI